MFRSNAIVAALIVATATTVSAAPNATPIPGGANAVNGVAGTFGQKLFNGEVRLVPRSLAPATPADDVMAGSGKVVVVFTATASNGTKKPLDMTQFVASISNADGDTYPSDKFMPNGGVYGVLPGASWRERVFFQVPPSFVATKIVLLPYDQKHAAFRIDVAPHQ